MEEKLLYRFKGGQTDTVRVDDIYQGRLYKEHFQPGKFLYNPHNISLTANTDGVALIKSSKINIWPIYMVINELPPKERYSVKCCLINDGSLITVELLQIQTIDYTFVLWGRGWSS